MNSPGIALPLAGSFPPALCPWGSTDSYPTRVSLPHQVQVRGCPCPTPNLLPKSLAWLQEEKIPQSLGTLNLPRRRGPTWARRKGLRVVTWGPRGRHQGWASSRLQVSPNHPLRPSGLTRRFSQRETGALRPETLRQGLHEVSHSAAQAQMPFPAPGTATMEAGCPVRGVTLPRANRNQLDHILWPPSLQASTREGSPASCMR